MARAKRMVARGKARRQGSQPGRREWVVRETGLTSEDNRPVIKVWARRRVDERGDEDAVNGREESQSTRLGTAIAALVEPRSDSRE